MGVFERWRVVITRCLLSIGGWRLEHTNSTCMADLLNSTSWNRPSTFFSTSQDAPGSASRAFLTGGQCFLGVVIFTTIFGDLLVYIACYLETNLRTRTNAFFLSLATADVLLAALVIPLEFVKLHFHPLWPLGELLCRTWKTVYTVLGTASLCSLCAIGIERYLAIARPLHHQNTITLAVLVSIFLLWFYSFINGLYSFFVWSESPTSCSEFSASFSGSIPLLVLGVLLPFGICLVVYFKIFRISRNQARKIAKVPGWVTNGGRNLLRERKSARTLSLLVGTFAVCCLPFFIFHVIDAAYDESLPYRFYADSVVRWLSYINSASNWALYGFLNRDFRATFFKIFHVNRLNRNRVLPMRD